MTRALEGVILLDSSRDFAAGVAKALPADFAATVIRVERPGRADVSAPDGWQGRVELAHRNELNLVLAFESWQGQGILEELVMRSTAVAVDGTPAEIEVRGLGDAKLRALNEWLLMVLAVGYALRRRF
jgi:crotonobetainyl-CoA:carnitine CoA-transferase CaiB-like acyl-CoA transferase